MKEDLEDKCTCETSYDYHRCPYADDVYNAYDSPDEDGPLCTCCEYCTGQCAMDV